MSKKDLDLDTLNHVLNLLLEQVNKDADSSSYRSGIQDGFNRSARLVEKLIDKTKQSNCSECSGDEWTDSGIGRKHCKCGNLKCSDCQILRGELMELEEIHKMLSLSFDCYSDIIEETDDVGLELAKMCGDVDLAGIQQGSEPSIYIKEFFAKVKAKYDNLELYLKQTSEDFECLPDCDSHGHNEYCPVTNKMEAFRKVYDKLKEYEKRISDLGWDIENMRNR